MAKILTDISTYTSTVTVPEAGDTAAAGVIETAYQALANRTRYLYDQDVSSDALIAALRAQANKGQWITKSANDIWVGTRHVATAADGWAPVGIGGNTEIAYALTATGAYSTIEVSFAVPMTHRGLEWAIWFVETTTPSTQARFEGAFYYPIAGGITSVSIPSTTVLPNTDYCGYSLSGIPQVSGSDGVYRMTIVSSSSTASSFQLLGAGVRFRDGDVV